MNKKGFIRTIEAVIAIVILLGLVLFIFGDKPKEIKKIPEVIEDAQNYIISEFLYNSEFKKCFTDLIINDADTNGKCDIKLSSIATLSGKNCRTAVMDFLDKAVPPGYSYECEICKTTRSCSTITFPKEKSVYPKSAFFYTKVNNKEEARILRIYMF